MAIDRARLREMLRVASTTDGQVKIKGPKKHADLMVEALKALPELLDELDGRAQLEAASIKRFENSGAPGLVVVQVGEKVPVDPMKILEVMGRAFPQWRGAQLIVVRGEFDLHALPAEARRGEVA